MSHKKQLAYFAVFVLVFLHCQGTLGIFQEGKEGMYDLNIFNASFTKPYLVYFTTTVKPRVL